MMDDGDGEEMYDWGDEQFGDQTLDMCDKSIGAKDIGDFLKSLGDELTEVSGMKVVDLSCNRIGEKNEDNDMQSIHRLLAASSTSLTALNLSGNPLGEEQRMAGPVLALAESLKGLRRLKVLDLSQCTLIGPASHRYKGLIALGSAFRGRKNRLTHLRLCNNSLHSEATLIVAGWLSAISKLRYLDLSGNPLAVDTFGHPSRVGFDPLCGGLRTLQHLRTLCMRRCGLDDDETESVAAFMESSVRLERLDLSGNKIHTRGARRLARALRSNGSLVSLLLRSNLVDDDGAELLVASIPHAESLGELDVSSNGLTDRIKEAFIDAAMASVTIHTYRISGNDISRADERAIEEHAAANIELKKVADAPETYDLWKASTTIEASLLAKFDRLPEGVAAALKRNPTFMEEGGNMKEAVLRACPPTKQELFEKLPVEARSALERMVLGPQAAPSAAPAAITAAITAAAAASGPSSTENFATGLPDATETITGDNLKGDMAS